MTWQPPPSFTSKPDHVTESPELRYSFDKTVASPKYDSKMRRTAWPPTFVVGTNEAETTRSDLSGNVVAPGQSFLNGQEPLQEKSSVCKLLYPTSTTPTVTRRLYTTTKTLSKRVGWNQTLFVVDGDTNLMDDAALVSGSHEHEEDFGSDITSHTEADETAIESEIPIQIPPRDTSGRFHKSFISKRELLLVDEAMLRTRLEWSQLLVSKAFKPYRQMICELDDDLPNPEAMNEIDDTYSNQDYLDGNNELIQVRNEMLADSDLSEREIAAFFEGYKLFQIKVNSLQSQLDGMKAMRKLSFHSSSIGTQKTNNDFLLTTSLPNRIACHPRIITTSEESFNKLGRMSLHRLFSVDEEVREPVISPAQSLESSSIHQESSPDPHLKAWDALDRHETQTQTQPIMRTTPATALSRSLRQMSIQRIRDTTSQQGGNKDIQKLLEELEEAERRQRKLEKQLAQAGVVIAEDIPYYVAKDKVESIAHRMGEIGGSDVQDRKLQEEYYVLEQQMEKYMTALQLSDEWVREQEELERYWEASITIANEEALKKIRRHMPVDVRNRSEGALIMEPSPNGKYLPANIAKKFKRTNVLQLLRTAPEDIIPMHAATLENLRVTGLTLTERRAIYHHLKVVGQRWKEMQGDKMTERKWTWFNMMKTNFRENVDSWQRHVDQYGPPRNHPYAARENHHTGCPLLGMQCPLKADTMLNYDGDYGYPEGPVYFKSEIKKIEGDDMCKANQEAQEVVKLKKSEQRNVLLKEHYKGNIFQLSLANGSCEVMDVAMDNMELVQEKWIKARLSNNGTPSEESKRNEVTRFIDALNELKLSVLPIAERSGMKLTGKRDSNADQPDVRSMVELSVCEEVIETAFDFFEGIDERMTEINMNDGRTKVIIHQLRTLLEELQERNRRAMKTLGKLRHPRSRELKSRTSLRIRVASGLEREGTFDPIHEGNLNASTKDDHGHERGGRGHSLDAIHGPSVRGGLLAAIAARGNR